MDIQRFSAAQWIKNDVVVSIRECKEDVLKHWHEFYEIELILDGSGTNSIDEIDYPIQKGRIFAMSPTSFHEPKFNESTTLINFMFTMDICDPQLLTALFSNKPHLILDISDKDIRFIQTLAEELITASSTKPEVRSKYCMHIFNVILGKLCTLLDNDLPTERSSALQRTFLYIQNHFTEQITLEDAAKFANYSPNYFSVKCKEYLGKSFKQYVIDLRISFAANLLKSSDLTVAQIMDRSGFRDMSNFLTAFRKRFHTSPKEYRLIEKQ